MPRGTEIVRSKRRQARSARRFEDARVVCDATDRLAGTRFFRQPSRFLLGLFVQFHSSEPRPVSVLLLDEIRNQL